MALRVIHIHFAQHFSRRLMTEIPTKWHFDIGNRRVRTRRVCMCVAATINKCNGAGAHTPIHGFFSMLTENLYIVLSPLSTPQSLAVSIFSYHNRHIARNCDSCECQSCSVSHFFYARSPSKAKQIISEWKKKKINKLRILKRTCV